jgi:hypothetical protein
LIWCPRQDSNLGTRLRRPVLYPLSYGGLSNLDFSIAPDKCQMPFPMWVGERFVDETMGGKKKGGQKAR